MNIAKKHLQPHLVTTGLNLGVVSVAMVLIMIFIMGLLKIYSPDLGFHLKSAEWIIAHKQFIYTDSFSVSSEGGQYFDLQWLYQLLIYGLYTQGAAVLVIANALLVTISFALLLFRFVKITESDNNKMKLALFAFITLLFVQPLSFEIRPHVLSWIYLNLTLFFLESYKRANTKALFALPIIMLLWINTHSLAVLGLITIAIYNAGSYLKNGQIDKRLLLFSGISLAACVINPYFIEGMIFPFKQFGIISGNNLFKSYVGELQSPFTPAEIKMMGAYYFISPLLIIHLSAIISVFSIFLSLKQKQYTDTLLLVTFLFLLHLGHKNYGYYLMVTLPLITKYTLNWLDSRNKKNKISQKEQAVSKKKMIIADEQKVAVAFASNHKLYQRVSYISIVVAILVSITSITDAYQLFRTSPYRFGFTESNDELPVEATNFLVKNHIRGRMLNHLNFGGYLMFHYKEKVFIDGRIEPMDENFFSKYYESNLVPGAVKNLLKEYDPEIVIFPYMKATNWWAYFLSNKNQSGYKPVYFDGLSVIYIKSSAFMQFPELKESDILSALDTNIVNRINQSIEIKKPIRPMVLMKGLWKKQSFSLADQNRATYCFTNGFDTAGIIYSVMGIENSTVRTPNIFKNLSIYYQEKKIYNMAQLCEEKSE